MLQFQALVPRMNINQVPGFNLNFGSSGDANSALTQAIRSWNISSASSHEPHVLFYKNFHFSWCHYVGIEFLVSFYFGKFYYYVK